MKSYKERVYEFIKLHMSEDESGVSTQTLTDAFEMQRPNMSAILNSLVREGRIGKTDGRPVLYYIPKGNTAKDCFDNLIGAQGSLKRAIQLAKAAVLYPDKSLNVLITGAAGTGKSFFASLIYRFAVESGVLPADAPYIVFDCKEYAGQDSHFTDKLFGNAAEDGYWERAARGVLLIDNAEQLPAGVRGLLRTRIGSDEEGPMVIAACDTQNRSVCEDLARKAPIVIDLPLLSERPLSERFEIIQAFFTLEAARLNRTLTISAELLRCLLLYDCDLNVMQLKVDIKIACANVFVREHGSSAKVFSVYIGDFEHYVRKGFLHYKARHDEIERIIPADYSYSFDAHTMAMSAIDRDKLKEKSMYDDLDRRAIELSKRGMAENEIHTVLSAELESIFHRYQSDLIHLVVNKDQLKKMVDGRIIQMVEQFLSDAAPKLNVTFPASVFYGLCLHLNAAVNRKDGINTVTSVQIAEILENWKAEYTLSLQLAHSVEQEFGITLPVDEVVLITMFLCYKAPMTDTTKKPVILYAFLGEGVAKALADAVLAITKQDNVYYYEIPSGQETEGVYDELKTVLHRIDRGNGVIVVYDMHFIGTILDAIETEERLIIRQLPIPLTTIGVEFSRKAALEGNIDSVYQGVIGHLNFGNLNVRRVIITLCSTGEGGAEELKNYIQKYGKLTDMDVIPLAMSDRDMLREEFKKIMQGGIIHCVVGTFNPELFAIPFVPVSDVLGVPKAELPEILKLKRVEKSEIDFNEVYTYLGEQLEHISIKKLKKALPPVIDRLNLEVAPLSLDSEVGLFIHLACAANRLLSGGVLPKNIRKDEIMQRYKKDFDKVLSILRPLEKAFGIIFTDDEIANIITIIRKI
ncbi:MAG: PRD domain-containing protein [Clostridia bacterium]|nr:PRD domain-containing protein [Clostridia bacterium]